MGEVTLWYKLGESFRFVCNVGAVEGPGGTHILLDGDQLLMLIDVATEALTWKEGDDEDTNHS